MNTSFVWRHYHNLQSFGIRNRHHLGGIGVDDDGDLRVHVCQNLLQGEGKRRHGLLDHALHHGLALLAHNGGHGLLDGFIGNLQVQVLLDGNIGSGRSQLDHIEWFRFAGENAKQSLAAVGNVNVGLVAEPVPVPLGTETNRGNSIESRNLEQGG